MKNLILILFTTITTWVASAQNTSNIDFNSLTPEQIEMYKQYISKTDHSASVSEKNSLTNAGRITNDSINTIKGNYSNKFFGSYLFNSQNLTFEPQLNIPTPRNYILGVNDEVLVDISGLYDANYRLNVSPDGNIRVPNVGLIKVAGYTIDDAAKKIRTEIAKYFQGTSSGVTKVNVSLGNIRSIRVIVIGEAVRPGSYTLPSLASAFNALYACGGPTLNGSMRDVKIIRNGKTISTLDVYGILTDGLPVKDISLQDGDIIRVEPYKTKIYITGATKRTGIFELLPNENIQKALGFAGGFNEKANKSNLKVFRYSDEGRTVLNVTSQQFSYFIPSAGDSIIISTTYENNEGYEVSISGEVKKPGVYQLIENFRLKDLITRAEGFTDIALTDSIELIRAIKNKDNLEKSQEKSTVIKIKLPKNISEISDSDNLQLENGDQVVVRAIPGFEKTRMIRVEGEIYLPGGYNLKNKSERVSDIISRAGGLTSYAYPKGAFLIRSESLDDTERKLNQIVKNNTLTQLNKRQSNTIDLNMLKATGVSSLDDISAIDTLQQKLSGSKIVNKVFAQENVVGLDLDAIMKNPKSKSDLKLENGDIIYIPREQQTVKVSGQVLFPTIVCYEESYKLNDYILNSGGFAENANKNNIFVLYSNGNVKGTKRFLFFRSYPKIEPGAQIIVSDKPILLKNKVTVGETVGILTSTTSMLVLIYSFVFNK